MFRKFCYYPVNYIYSIVSNLSVSKIKAIYNLSDRIITPKKIDGISQLYNKIIYNKQDLDIYNFLYTLFSEAKKSIYMSNVFALNLYSTKALFEQLNNIGKNIPVYFILDASTTYFVSGYSPEDYIKQYPNIQFKFYGKNNLSGNIATYHKKIFIIDDTIIYSGICFDQNFMYDTSYWIDSCIAIKDAKLIKHEIDLYKTEFNMATDFCNIIDPAIFSYGKIISESYTKYEGTTGYDTLKKYLNLATKSVTITTNFFIPDDNTFGLFENILKNDIELTIITNLNARSNVRLPMYYLDKLSTYPNCKIFVTDSTNHYIHAKILAIDETYLIYTTMNITYKSIYHDCELYAIIEDRHVIADASKFIKYLKSLCGKYEPSGYPYFISYIFNYIMSCVH